MDLYCDLALSPGTEWLGRVQAALPRTPCQMQTTYDPAQNVIHPCVVEFFHGFCGYRYVCAITAFLCVVSGMVVQAWRFRLDAAWRRHFPLAATWSAACFALLWVHALWPPAGRGWVQKLLIALIVAAMLLAGAWLHQAARRADGGAGR